jgi:repressor LexA
MMGKAPTKLTSIQSRALDFIRTSVERSGTAPTLRELCAHMGYSAIGSAQDLVAALRKKGFLQTPDKQAARSLVLTSKALALHEPQQPSSESTLVIPCLERIPPHKHPLEIVNERVGVLRMSLTTFARPYPAHKNLFALRATGDAMLDAGIMDGDWLVVHGQETAEAGDIVAARVDDEVLVRRLMKDRNGWYLRPENISQPIIRLPGEDALNVLGQVIALQRVFPKMSIQ